MKNYQIIFSIESREDLISIQNHIYQDSQSHTIADNFVINLYETLISSLPNFPHKHPVHNKNIRKFTFPRYTNYNAYFEIDEENERLVVLAITASRQFTRYMKF
ncbi:MAG: plasmid stabilization system protein ParE [Phenylobacterium sp.]|jgi:plasmid stabilization system protein ParE